MSKDVKNATLHWEVVYLLGVSRLKMCGRLKQSQAAAFQSRVVRYCTVVEILVRCVVGRHSFTSQRLVLSSTWRSIPSDYTILPLASAVIEFGCGRTRPILRLQQLRFDLLRLLFAEYRAQWCLAPCAFLTCGTTRRSFLLTRRQ